MVKPCLYSTMCFSRSSSDISFKITFGLWNEMPRMWSVVHIFDWSNWTCGCGTRVLPSLRT